MIVDNAEDANQKTHAVVMVLGSTEGGIACQIHSGMPEKEALGRHRVTRRQISGCHVSGSTKSAVQLTYRGEKFFLRDFREPISGFTIHRGVSNPNIVSGCRNMDHPTIAA